MSLIDTETVRYLDGYIEKININVLKEINFEGKFFRAIWLRKLRGPIADCVLGKLEILAFCSPTSRNQGYLMVKDKEVSLLRRVRKSLM